jgi:hypothetical protein
VSEGEGGGGDTQPRLVLGERIFKGNSFQLYKPNYLRQSTTTVTKEYQKIVYRLEGKAT